MSNFGEDTALLLIDIQNDFCPGGALAVDQGDEIVEISNKIQDQFKIKILPVHWFLATKWEAFKNRGNDPRTSPDFEDIIYVIDNNSNIISDFENTHKSVKNFLQNMCLEIINHPSKNQIIECHINPYTVVERKKIILDKLNFMAFYQ